MNTLCNSDLSARLCNGAVQSDSYEFRVVYIDTFMAETGSETCVFMEFPCYFLPGIFAKVV